jgi:4-hydroxy-3-methylbut-2-enyl diphosphate reductase
VVGSTNSSNSNRLVEVSKNLGTNSYLIDKAERFEPEWLEGATRLLLPRELRRPRCW